MIAALIVLAVANMVMAVALVATIRHGFDEADAWAVERRALVDRIIAKHSGEVIALDRTASPKRSSLDNVVERPTPVGL